MAFNFAKTEPITFGDFLAAPVMTQENILRVSQIKIKLDNLDEAREILASCFGDETSKVKAFMRDNFFPMDYVRLQIYLIQGNQGLQDYERQMDVVTIERAKKAMEQDV